MQYEDFTERIVNCKDGRVKPLSGKFDATLLEQIKNKTLKGGTADENFSPDFITTFVPSNSAEWKSMSYAK